MEIHAIQNNSVYQTAQKAQAGQMPQQQPKADTDEANSPAANQFPHDEYISSGQASEKPSGLYRVIPDDDGKPKILYDDPEKPAANPPKDEEAEKPENINADTTDDKSENCTTNTDKVDREIEKLKKLKNQLEQEIKQASGDEKKVEELERKLSSIESELSQKDNDTYRQQNAEVS